MSAGAWTTDFCCAHDKFSADLRRSFFIELLVFLTVCCLNRVGSVYFVNFLFATQTFFEAIFVFSQIEQRKFLNVNVPFFFISDSPSTGRRFVAGGGVSSPDLDSLSQGSGSQPGGRSMGVETRWSSKEDLLSERGVGSPTTSGVISNVGSITMDQIENSLFVALYDFNSMSEDQLTLRKGKFVHKNCFSSLFINRFSSIIRVVKLL